jgi:quercetin dioxygenase-like cupin family protein
MPSALRIGERPVHEGAAGSLQISQPRGNRVSTSSGPRYGVDAYMEWLGREGIPIVEGLAIDLISLETADWARYGAKGAAAHLDGRGDFCNMFKLELPPTASTNPQRHMYEEVVYVLDGRGSTQLEFADGVRRSFEWGSKSLFAIPLNVTYRHFNASGTQSALLAVTTNLPLVLNLYHNERFVFENDFVFVERLGPAEYYTGGGDLHVVRPGNNMWETNFVSDLSTIELMTWRERGAGGASIMFVLADGSMHAHVSEMPPGTYKKAHRHPAGYHVMCVAGSGYSLLWSEGDEDFLRVDWQHGTVFPPADGQFHQHFTTSRESARYLATGLGGIRYPITRRTMEHMVGKGGGRPMLAAVSLKEGGNQIEYEDQDPRIHALWLAELERRELSSAMDEVL